MGGSAVDLKGMPPELLELVEEARRHGEIVLTHKGDAVAKIVTLPHVRARAPRQPGSERGLIIRMADDFDTTPPDFDPIVA
jgi:antitoxin (DNA-binding transcriptional repressor) of toxin-antitoxin stability system